MILAAGEEPALTCEERSGVMTWVTGKAEEAAGRAHAVVRDPAAKAVLLPRAAENASSEISVTCAGPNLLGLEWCI